MALVSSSTIKIEDVLFLSISLIKSSFSSQEITRLGKIMAKGKITRDKFADMVLKQNVLNAFLVEES